MQRLLAAVTMAAALLLTAEGARAASCPIGGDDFCGSYTATATYLSGGTSPSGVPTITDDLATPIFGFNLTTVGAATGAAEFITTNPPSGPSSGTYTSTINVAFTFVDPSGLSSSVTASGTYTANYSNLTDSVNWAGATTTSNGGEACYTGTEGGEPADDACLTLVANFTDGASLAITLNNAQDWNITPYINFTLLDAPPKNIPEPASLALLGTALAGFGLLRHRRRGA